jgi:hypothetical protein
MSDIITRFHRDEAEGLIYAERIQDVEEILEQNKALQNENQKFAGDWHHLGTIPNVILEKWMNEDGCNPLAMSGDEFGKYIKKKLRDPDNAWLRTTNRKF